MDVNDSNLIWALSPHLLNALDTLDLDVALVSRNNAGEFRDLLRAILVINFDECSLQWALRRTAVGRSPGRQDDGADFAYYDPRTRKRISAQRAHELQPVRSEIPGGHPMGWEHSVIPAGGWAPVSNFATPEVGLEGEFP